MPDEPRSKPAGEDDDDEAYALGLTIDSPDEQPTRGLDELARTIDSPSRPAVVEPVGGAADEDAMAPAEPGLGQTITSPDREPPRQPGLGDTLLLMPRETVKEFGFLVVRCGPREGDIFKLVHTKNVIGRDRVVSAFVDDPHVSGQHASIRCERVPSSPRGEFVLRDLDSENGTYLNGTRLTAEAVLKDGDVVRVGQTELVFKRI